MTGLILRLVNFLLSLLVEADDQAARIDKALVEVDKTLALAGLKAQAIGDFSGEDDCWTARLRLAAVRAKLKPRSKTRVRAPRIKVVWPG